MKYVALVLLTLCSCKQPLVEVPGPLGLPPLRVERVATAEEIALGKKLFFDPKLSLDKTISCSTCHNPEKGFADARKVSEGVGGKKGNRNAPTVLNAAHWRVQFWDGRAATLEEQAAGPMGNVLEMNHKPELLMQRLAADPEYGPMKLTVEKVLHAIASYERTLLSANSPFDRYTYGGDKSALSAEALEGFKVFGRHCVVCHMIGPKDALFTDQEFHNIGIGVNSEGVLTDQGRGKGEFRTPSLRNVARTAPYMHDGSLKTLREVVDYYVGGGNSNEHLDPQIRPFELSRQERDALIAFLESLNGVDPK